MRTGLHVTRAATASSGCTDTSSLPPKPPRHAVGLMRTLERSTPSTRAVSSRSMYGAWVQQVASMRSPQGTA